MSNPKIITQAELASVLDLYNQAAGIAADISERRLAGAAIEDGTFRMQDDPNGQDAEHPTPTVTLFGITVTDSRAVV